MPWMRIGGQHETKIENYMEALFFDEPFTPYSGYLGACKKDLSTRWLQKKNTKKSTLANRTSPPAGAPNHHYYPRWG